MADWIGGCPALINKPSPNYRRECAIVLPRRCSEGGRNEDCYKAANMTPGRAVILEVLSRYVLPEYRLTLLEFKN